MIWDEWLTQALAKGSLKCKPEPKVVGRGLNSVQAGLDLQAQGVSAQKLVIDLSGS